MTAEDIKRVFTELNIDWHFLNARPDNESYMADFNTGKCVIIAIDNSTKEWYEIFESDLTREEFNSAITKIIEAIC